MWGIARWSMIHCPVAMCQLTSPSLKIVFELPRIAGISSTAMNSGRIATCFSAGLWTGAVITFASSGTRPLRRPAAVDRVKHEPDHLRAHEEQLRAIGQADEQV